MHTYDDFLNGDCQLVLLIYDCEFVEIYVKYKAIVRALYENALSNKYTEVEYITDSNDARRLDIK